MYVEIDCLNDPVQNRHLLVQLNKAPPTTGVEEELLPGSGSEWTLGWRCTVKWYSVSVMYTDPASSDTHIYVLLAWGIYLFLNVHSYAVCFKVFVGLAKQAVCQTITLCTTLTLQLPHWQLIRSTTDGQCGMLTRFSSFRDNMTSLVIISRSY